MLAAAPSQHPHSCPCGPSGVHTQTRARSHGAQGQELGEPAGRPQCKAHFVLTTSPRRLLSLEAIPTGRPPPQAPDLVGVPVAQT